MVRRSSVPSGAAEAVAVAVVPLRCTGTRPRLHGDGDDGTTTDDGDGEVPRLAKTTGNSHRPRLFPNPGDGALVLKAPVGVAVGAHVAVAVVVADGGDVDVVGVCRKSLPCGCFAVLLDGRFRTLQHRQKRKNVFY